MTELLTLELPCQLGWSSVVLTWDALIPFLVTVVVFASVPGPAVVYTAAQTLAGGRTAGLMAALGMHIGGYVHIVAAATGLALVLQGTPMVLTSLKLLGALYLAFLGIALLWSRSADGEDTSMATPGLARRALLEGMTVQILNPAAAVFYVAFLPQFVDTSGSWPLWVQFVLLGVVVNAIFTVTKLGVVVIAGTATAWLRQPIGRRRHVQRMAGTTLLAAALHLMLWTSLV
jgi:threonine/homoserine/homoserine lactone efflux protein